MRETRRLKKRIIEEFIFTRPLHRERRLTIERMLMVSLAILAFAFAVGAAYPADRADVVTVEAPNALYRNAVEDARAGKTTEALVTLRSLVEHFPERQDMLGEFTVVLGWTGDHATTLALLDRINLASAPPYVIEGLANSARRLQRYDLAESLYLETIARFPERVEPQIGLACTLADAGKLDNATPLFERLRAQESAHRGTLRGKIQTLTRLGAPQLAIELANHNPGVLAPYKRDAIAADRTAHQIRWGSIAADTGRGPTRFADSELAGTRALDPAAELTSTERQLALDRVVALREHYRMRDAVA